MGNDADQFPFVFEARQDGKCGIQSCLVERSEPFVQKERIHPYVAARETRKTQCERETHDEGFAAREVLRRTDVAAAVAVDDVDRQRGLFFRREFVPVGEFHERLIGKPEKALEGKSLHEFTVAFAVCGTDEVF